MAERRRRLLAAGLVVLSGGGALAASDPEQGEIVFQKCYACHSVVPGETGLSGPNLAGVVGREVAALDDFAYSEAMRQLPARGVRVWSEAALDAFLEDPEAFAPGTGMTFVGLASAEERAHVIAYLKTRHAARKE